ncbi:ABC transporter permease [Paracidobacterium acidisoli]|uniref:Transport permease protein n=1 Tax=Paracidobacterium acidisoli TaxID=2303751 RepID=A0A372ITT6_9BACT|nr:ABC transporter permease [Paracidobacterium acidisoli]MBT9329755.1 ABC transporter permease [Paracidobacterium acidisoli]
MATLAVAHRPQPFTAGYYARLFRKETQYEILKMLRTRMFSISVIGFPVMFYLLFGATNRHSDYARYLLAGYSCFGAVSACLFGMGMGIALERAQGWMELKQASPLPRLAYLGAKTISCALFGLITTAVLLVLGITMGGVHLHAAETARLFLVVFAGSLPFCAMGLLIALIVPANSAPGMINLINLPMSFASGLWMPIDILPHWLQRIAPALPMYHFAQIALRIFGFARPGSALPHWEALAGFTCVMLGIAWVVFTRSEARS